MKASVDVSGISSELAEFAELQKYLLDNPNCEDYELLNRRSDFLARTIAWHVSADHYRRVASHNQNLATQAIIN